MSTVWPGTAMDDDGDKVIHPIWVHGVVRLNNSNIKRCMKSPSLGHVRKVSFFAQVHTYRVKQPQLQRENDPVRNFDEPIHLLHIFEPFQM